MRLRSISLAPIAMVLGALAAVGVAWAVTTSDSPNGDQAVPRQPLDSAAELRIFRGSFEPTPAQEEALKALAARNAEAPADSLLGTAQYAKARPVPVPGTSREAWIVPAADGALCTFTPVPGGGSSGDCSTLDQFNATGIVSVATGASSTAVVTVVQPDGVADPVIASPDGRERTVPLVSNVAIATAEDGETVTAGGLTLRVRAHRIIPVPSN